MFTILSTCRGGGYHYCRTNPPHPKRNSKGLYPLHRVVMENRLGRLLVSGEEVHHKDQDKANNDPENLEVRTKADHTAHHHTLNDPPLIEVECQCGNVFRIKPHQHRLRLSRNKSGRIFCSRSCGYRFA